MGQILVPHQILTISIGNLLKNNDYFGVRLATLSNLGSLLQWSVHILCPAVQNLILEFRLKNDTLQKWLLSVEYYLDFYY